VQGKKGERFVYLTWGIVEGGSFSMFRRAKLMLAHLPADADEVTVDVDLTDECGMPRCARLRPPATRIGVTAGGLGGQRESRRSRTFLECQWLRYDS
jgi:hypothetical protein